MQKLAATSFSWWFLCARPSCPPRHIPPRPPCRRHDTIWRKASRPPRWRRSSPRPSTSASRRLQTACWRMRNSPTPPALSTASSAAPSAAPQRHRSGARARLVRARSPGGPAACVRATAGRQRGEADHSRRGVFPLTVCHPLLPFPFPFQARRLCASAWAGLLGGQTEGTGGSTRRCMRVLPRAVPRPAFLPTDPRTHPPTHPTPCSACGVKRTRKLRAEQEGAKRRKLSASPVPPHKHLSTKSRAAHDRAAAMDSHGSLEFDFEAWGIPAAPPAGNRRPQRRAAEEAAVRTARYARTGARSCLLQLVLGPAPLRRCRAAHCLQSAQWCCTSCTTSSLPTPPPPPAPLQASGLARVATQAWTRRSCAQPPPPPPPTAPCPPPTARRRSAGRRQPAPPATATRQST